MFQVFVAVVIICFTGGECLKLQADPVLTKAECISNATSLLEIAVNSATEDGLEVTLLRWKCFELEVERGRDT